MTDRERLEIVRLATGGDGIAETSGGLRHVPLALPGEVWVGDPLRLLAPSPTNPRQTPPCRHFGDCGGCSAQHMPDQLYAEWKRDIVTGALARAHVDGVVAPLVRIAPATRRRAQLTATRSAAGVALGFHAEGSHRLVAIERCEVLAPPLRDAVPVLRSIAGTLLRPESTLRITVLILDRGLDVAIAMEGAAPPPAARARVGEIVRTSAIARVTLGDDLLVQQGPARLTIDGASIDVPPRAFLQASAEAEEAIARLVIAGVGKAKRIADLFSGLGTFALRIARSGPVAAYDADPPSIAALTAAARGAQGRKPITATRRDLMREPLSRKELEGFDAVVLDPPRAGAKAQCETLARSVVPRVVMVSCNPATLARDMAILMEAGYVPGTVTPIDQFVWSGHVEAVVTLTRRAR